MNANNIEIHPVRRTIVWFLSAARRIVYLTVAVVFFILSEPVYFLMTSVPPAKRTYVWVGLDISTPSEFDIKYFAENMVKGDQVEGELHDNFAIHQGRLFLLDAVFLSKYGPIPILDSKCWNREQIDALVLPLRDAPQIQLGSYWTKFKSNCRKSEI